MLLNGDDCWLKKFKDTLLCTRTCGVDMWTTWLNDNDFRVTCSRNEEYIDGIYRAVRWETDCLNAFHEVARNEWYMDVTRIEAKRGEGRNKLRTLSYFKLFVCHASLHYMYIMYMYSWINIPIIHLKRQNNK